MNIETRLHVYNFDVRAADQRQAWKDLKARLRTGPRCMGPVFGDMCHAFKPLDGKTIALETAHLFDNQWNTPPIEGVSDKGIRVFDWALEHVQNRPNIKRGHYLDQTAEMREIRRSTNVCPYCGHQEAAARGSVFCPKCIDSEYLKEEDILKGATRMRAVDAARDWAPLTEAEREHLLPLYRAAQMHGTTERGRARIARKRVEIADKYHAKTSNARVERDGFLWLMDHGMAQLAADNVIFYSHTGRFGFGWRRTLSAAETSAVLEKITEFPFPYDIKGTVQDGDGKPVERTLSGD